MGELGVIALLWLLFGKKPQAAPTPSDSAADHSTPGATGGDGAGGGAGAGLVGALTTGAGLLIKALTAGGATAAGAGATAGTAGTVAGTAAGVASAGALGVASVLLLANPIAWAIYILVGTIISKHQSESKNFELAVYRLGANARGLHEYERSLWDEFEKNTSQRFLREEVRDGRLDYAFNHQGSRVTFLGKRTTVRPANPPPPAPSGVPWEQRTGYLLSQGQLYGKDLDLMFRRIRAAALVYLSERARYGVAILFNKQNKTTIPAGYQLDEFAMLKQHEILEARLGGLSQVPTLSGAVIAGSRLEPENPFPPVEQLIGANTEPNVTDLTLADVKAARVAALLDAVCLFRHDLTIDLRAPGAWADNLFIWLGNPAGITRAGRTWTLDREIFGAEFVIDVWAAKTGTGRILTGSV